MPYADPDRFRELYRQDPDKYRARNREQYARNPEPARERARAARQAEREARAERERRRLAEEEKRRRYATEVADLLRETIPEPVPFTGDKSWLDQAECRDMDVGLFFERTPPVEAREACLVCPVRAECLGMALAYPVMDLSGLWGGVSHQRRKRLKRAERRVEHDVEHLSSQAVAE